MVFRRRRSLALAALWLATAVASGVLTAVLLASGDRAADRSDAQREAAGPVPREIEPPDARVPGLAAPRPAPAAFDATPARAPHDAGGATSVVLRVQPCTVAVTVTTAEGEPARSAWVYAAPNGSRDAPRPAWPFVVTDDDGRAELRLPAAGRWDVAAADNHHYALERDVVAPADATRPVRLVLEADAPIDVEVVGGGKPAAWSLFLVEATEGARDLPLRSEPGVREFQLESGGTSLVPRGVPLRIASLTVRGADGGSGTWIAESDVVTAPAIVRVQPVGDDRLGHVRVEARFEAVREPRPRSVNFTCRDRGVRVSFGSTRPVGEAGGEPLATLDLRRLPGTSVFVGGEATPGHRGEFEVVVPAAGESRTERLLLRSLVDRSDPWADRLEVVRADGTPIDRERSAVGLRARTGDEGAWDFHPPAGAAGVRAMVVVGAWRTSDLFDLPAAGPVRVTVGLGGYLLIDTPHGADDRMGGLCLERLDGGWLGTRGNQYLLPPDHPDAEGDVSDPFERAFPGALLGPLPAGDVPLRVTLGGVEVGRVTARVRAGEVTVLSLR